MSFYKNKTDARASKTLRLCFLAMLLSLGLVLPTFFHFAGGPAAGKIFLPLHIPVLIAGLVLGAADGLFLGLLLPVLSALISGMPSPVILPFMMIELSFYGIFCGIFKSLTKKNGVSLILALICGRLLYAFVLLLLARIALENVPAAIAVAGSALSGLAGIVIQLIFVPPLCGAAQRYTFARHKKQFEKA